MPTPNAPHTEATTAYWQRLIGADEAAPLRAPPWRLGYPAALPDGRFLVLPIRALVKCDFFTAGWAGAIEKNSKPCHDELW